jgi:hypothetical protein
MLYEYDIHSIIYYEYNILIILVWGVLYDFIAFLHNRTF